MDTYIQANIGAGAVRHQTIIYTNIDLWSKVFCGISKVL